MKKSEVEKKKEKTEVEPGGNERLRKMEYCDSRRSFSPSDLRVAEWRTREEETRGERKMPGAISLWTRKRTRETAINSFQVICGDVVLRKRVAVGRKVSLSVCTSL